MITFNTDGMIVQRFPFPAPIMDYILKNLQPQHLVKLYQCCKFFYAKYHQNIILNLQIVADGGQETFDPTSTTVCVSNPVLQKLKDFWITDSFLYSAPKTPKIMPSFSHCTIKKLEACNCLFWKEYETLTKAGTVQELMIGLIYDEDDDDYVSISKILAQVPNATSIEITEIILSSTSFASLAALNHQVKITNFVLKNIYHYAHFNIDLLFEFFNKYADPDCNVHFDFDMDFDFDDEVDLEQMGIEYTNIIASKLAEKKKELVLEKSTLMP